MFLITTKTLAIEEKAIVTDNIGSFLPNIILKRMLKLLEQGIKLFERNKEN